MGRHRVERRLEDLEFRAARDRVEAARRTISRAYAQMSDEEIAHFGCAVRAAVGILRDPDPERVPEPYRPGFVAGVHAGLVDGLREFSRPYEEGVLAPGPATVEEPSEILGPRVSRVRAITAALQRDHAPG